MTMTNDNDTLSKGLQCQSDSWPYGHSDGVMTPEKKRLCCACESLALLAREDTVTLLTTVCNTKKEKSLQI